MDPITQITVALPMILLYEFGLILIRITEPEKKTFRFYIGIIFLIIIVVALMLSAIIVRFDTFQNLIKF